MPSISDIVSQVCQVRFVPEAEVTCRRPKRSVPHQPDADRNPLTLRQRCPQYSFLGGYSMLPVTKYAQSGDVFIAYQISGHGPIDIVFAPGFISHLELMWDEPRHARFLHGLGSSARLIRFDKRGTGLFRPQRRLSHAG